MPTLTEAGLLISRRFARKKQGAGKLAANLTFPCPASNPTPSLSHVPDLLHVIA